MTGKSAYRKFDGETYEWYSFAGTKKELAKMINRVKRRFPNVKFRVIKRDSVSQSYKKAKLVRTYKSHYYDLYVRY